MKKAIFLGNGLDIRYDLDELINLGISGLYINGELEKKIHDSNFARERGIQFLIVDVAYKPEWKSTVDQIDAEYYYIDEPYLNKTHTDEELIEILNYVKIKRPNSKFVIGDIRLIQEKKYKPIDGLYYTYTSYTDNWYIPFIDKAIPIGFPDQSPSIKRIYNKTDGRVPFIWVYGQNKLLCHPDEYHKLYKTAKELGLEFMCFYVGDGSAGDDKYIFNIVPRVQLIDNLNHFINNEKPYTTIEWISRLYNRLKISFKFLYKTGNFKRFIYTLF